MITIVVLFNLRDRAAVARYETWARTIDHPSVTRLPSVAGFELLRCRALLSGASAPYQYVEIIRVRDQEQFGKDIGSEHMQAVASQFQGFAQDPLFILAENF